MTDIAPAPSSRRRQQNALACEECRARKLRCDMGEPQCATCGNLGIPCIVNTARRPRGPRKGHVKILKSRISTLERQLSDKAEAQARREQEGELTTTAQPALTAESCLNLDLGEGALGGISRDRSLSLPVDYNNNLIEAQPFEFPAWPTPMPAVDLDTEWSRQIEALPDSAYFLSTLSLPGDIPNSTPTGPMDIGMQPLELEPPSGVGSPLLAGPSPVQMSALERADLDDVFFERAYMFAPIVHQQRYYARSAREPDMGEPFICLQHAMRTVAASMCSQFKGILPLLCGHAQSILNAWEQKVPDEALPFELVQARLLLAIYEILKTNPRKGWISAGRCFHLVHLVKLDEIDNPRSWKTSTLSWVEIEERRRTFWTVYALDRYANLVNGLPITLNDHMILTRLPASEAAFRRQQPVKTEFLAAAMIRINEQLLSPYAKSIIIVTILARCFSHRNQCKVERIMYPSCEECLERHRKLEATLCQGIQATMTDTSLDTESSLSEHIFIEMLAQAAVLVLFTALKSVPDDSIPYHETCSGYEKKAFKAAEKIHSLAQHLPQLGCFRVHPFTPIALFICADFMRSPMTLSPNNASQFKTMCACLRHLGPANNLAQMLEIELQRHPDTAGTARGF
ncbi:uncharacterized protein BDV14DRAFT_211284 [Aspergillus stella-maris]|uniref:uncharacterized protein n=1 Tax=Aspergillus stella-maris TaxID=1810926 RepID=UPI003CCD7FFC